MEVENPETGIHDRPEDSHLEVPGAVLHHHVRSNDSWGAQPVMLLIGSPMGASGFGTLAGHFADRTVVTYDPRRAERANVPTALRVHARRARGRSAPADRCAGRRPVDIFAGSGGAVYAQALVARHPERVRTLVAHEPPASQELPDREPTLAACVDIHQTYQRKGWASARQWRNSAPASPLPERCRAAETLPELVDLGQYRARKQACACGLINEYRLVV